MQPLHWKKSSTLGCQGSPSHWIYTVLIDTSVFLATVEAPWMWRQLHHAPPPPPTLAPVCNALPGYIHPSTTEVIYDPSCSLPILLEWLFSIISYHSTSSQPILFFNLIRLLTSFYSQGEQGSEHVRHSLRHSASKEESGFDPRAV